MNAVTKVFLLAIFSFILISCQESDSGKNSASAPNANSPVGNSQTNSYVASNGETMQPAFNVETKNVVSENQNTANTKVSANNVQTEKQPEGTNEQPAADNSVYTAEMNEKGQPVETRIFKSHPILAKIEKITLSPRDYVYKIYLKDGKVVESKSEELKQFRFIAPENILDAIDRLPKATPDPNDPTKDGKKKQLMMQQSNQ